jgi:hypothetical protein
MAMKQSAVKGATKASARKPAAGKGATSPPIDRGLKDNWDRLHETDLEPYPDEKLVSRLAGKYSAFDSWVLRAGGAARVAQGLQTAWTEFHAGAFLKAVALGHELGALGASAANKAAAVYSPRCIRIQTTATC